MTNAKSRLVRVMAFALAMLMVVMAFAACGSESSTNNVDTEALDAAIKAAQDAADKAAQEAAAAADKIQAAQDAADKAAQDAADAKAEAESAKQEAADKIQAAQDAADKAAQDAADAKAEAEKAKQEAENAKQELENIKNTTAAPASTTAPVVVADKATIDAYVAAMLYAEDSEFNQLLDADYSAYAAADLATLLELFQNAAVAIQRADSIEYVNLLIAGLKADVAKVPTYSQRVKMVFDAIDFDATDDVVDVVYAANFVKEAIAALNAARYAENADVINAEIAAIYAYGEDKIEIANLVATAYYRYTGINNFIPNTSVNTVDVKVLYADVYANAKAARIANKMQTLFGVESAYDALDVANIVYDADLDAEIKAIVSAYESWFKTFNRKDYASLYADFCVAFVGEEYILIQEGDYLNEKLADAQARAAELKAAATDYNKNIKTKLEALVAAYNAAGMDFDAIKNNAGAKGVAAVAELLNAWVETYGFVDGDDNFDAIIGSATYADFIECKAFVAAVESLYASANALDAAAIEKALDEAKDYEIFTYSKYYSAVAAMFAWVESYAENMEVYGQVDDDDVNFVAILDKALDITVADAQILYAAAEKAAAAKVEADKINAAIVELEVLKQNKIDEIGERIAAYIADFKCAQVLDEVAEMLNYDLIDVEGFNALQTAYDESIAYIQDEGSIIIKKYIGWQGAANEDGFAYGENVFAVDAFAVTMFSYEDIKAMAETYAKLKVAENDSSIVIKIDAVDAEEPVKFTLRQATDMFKAMSDHFYYNIWQYYTEDASANKMNNYSDGTLKGIGCNALLATGTGTTLGGYNEWKYGGMTTQSNLDKVLAGTSTTWTVEEVNAHIKLKGWNDEANAKYKGQISMATNSYGTQYTYAGKYGYKLSAATITPSSYVKNSTFDKAAYDAAVETAQTNALKNWKIEYAKDVARNYNLKSALNTVLNFVLNVGLLEITDTFNYAGSEYTFVISTNTTKVPGSIKQNNITRTEVETGLTRTLYLYNEDGELVGTDKAGTAKIGDKAVTYSSVADTITVKLGSATLADAIKADLGDDYDAKVAKSYEYKLIDYVDAIMAKNDAAGKVAKPYASGNFRKFERAYIETVYNAYVENCFYAELYSVLKYAYNYTETTDVAYLAKGYDIDLNVTIGKQKENFGKFAQDVAALFTDKGASANDIKDLKLSFVYTTDEQWYAENANYKYGKISIEQAEAAVAYHVAQISAIAIEFAAAKGIDVTPEEIFALAPAFLND